MQTIFTLKTWSILIICLVIGFTEAMAQARYKHLPRVRIEKTIINEKTLTHQQPEQINIPVSGENNKEMQEQVVVPEATEMASSTPDNVVLVPKKNVTKSQLKTNDVPQKANKEAFTEAVKNKSNLLEVKEVKQVKKTAIIGYLLWFLIVLLLGIALFVLAFVFLGIIAYSLYYVFLVFGIVGLAIALLILIFGLTGIIA